MWSRVSSNGEEKKQKTGSLLRLRGRMPWTREDGEVAQRSSPIGEDVSGDGNAAQVAEIAEDAPLNVEATGREVQNKQEGSKSGEIG